MDVGKMPRSQDSPGSEKSKKYDRQLRLWGDRGQSAIEGARVCVVNAGPTGTEVLKNLILPGVGSFTIIDSHVVTYEDVGCNFFLDINSVGRNRGSETLKYLLELNPDVRGDHLEETVEEILDNNPKLFASYSTVVITDQVKEESLVRLATFLYDKNIPILVAKINGLFAYVRLQIMEHVVMESKPDSVLEDMRLDCPFPKLKENLESTLPEEPSWQSYSRREISHLPFVTILWAALRRWRREFNRGPGELPSVFKEKEQLRNVIRDWMAEIKNIKWSEEGHDQELDLMNFDEARRAVNSVLVDSSKIPSSTQEVINSIDGHYHKKNLRFWILVKGLKEFISQYRCLPLRGSIPDMTCDSKSYVTLQQIYSQKAKEDADIFGKIVSTISDFEFSESDIRIFCRNSHYLRVIRTPSLAQEYSSVKKNDTTEDQKLVLRRLKDLITTDDMNNDPDSSVSRYLAFRAVDRFHSRFSRLPGIFKDEIDEDVGKLKSCLKDVLADVEASSAGGTRDDLIHAYVSFGGSKVHGVASFVGGIVGQEVIKMLTQQFVPIQHTAIFNGITANVETLDF